MSIKYMGQSLKASDGYLHVISRPYEHAIGEGNIESHSLVRIFGSNDAVGTTMEVVSEVQGTQGYVSSAETLKVSSASTQDDTGGTGALTLTLEGLDANYAAISETVTMDGTASVATTNSYLRVYNAVVATAGTNNSNVGIISIKDNADSVTLLKILADHGASSAAIYTVPAGKSLIVSRWWGASTSTQNVLIHLYCKPLNAAWKVVEEIPLLDNSMERNISGNIIVPAKTDIEIRANTAASTAIVGAGLQGWVE